ncbi:MAG: ATP-binding protein [Bacteroidales bacterium]|nr:ATP-binding protein [Bacteroidales bacterium]
MKKLLLYLTAFFITISQFGCTSENETATTITDIHISSTLSNQRIMGITQDGDGYMWFGTYRGLNRYNGHEMHQYFCDDKPNSIPDNQIRAVYTDHNGDLWVATKNGIAKHTEQDDFEQIPIHSQGKFIIKFAEDKSNNLYAFETNSVLQYDTARHSFELVMSNIERDNYINYGSFFDSEDKLWIINRTSAICYNIRYKQIINRINLPGLSVQTAELIGDELWIGNDGNFLIYNVKEQEWEDIPEIFKRHPKFKNLYIDCIKKIYDNNVLIGTLDGLFIYNQDKKTLVHESEANFPFKAPNFNVTDAFTDADGNLWLSSESKGFFVYTRASNQFSSNNYLRTTFMDKPVSSIAVDPYEKIWVAEQHDRIYRYDPETNDMIEFELSKVSPTMYNERIRIYYIYPDSHGDIWVSCLPKGLLQLRYENNQLRLIGIHDVGMAIVISEDKNGTIWIGCYNSNYYTKKAGDKTFEAHRLFNNTFTYLACLKQLRNGKFAALIKEQCLRYADLDKNELTPPVIPDSTLEKCIERNVFLPSALLEDHLGNLWIGTVSNGLMRYDPYTGELTNIEGITCEDICSIEEDQQGNIWVSTQFGLAKYNTATNIAINYYRSDGIGGNEFYDRTSCQLADGTLIFGGAHGLTVFNPTQLKETSDIRLYFEDLKIHNQVVRPSQSASISKSLRSAEEIKLNHHENSFSISFAALDYCGDDRFSYQYILDGFNDEWVDAHNIREAFYANLKPKNYTFRVRLTNKDHTQVLVEKAIAVKISPAPWATWWAEMIYAFVSVGLILFIFHLYMRLHMEQWTRQQSEREKEHEKHVNRMNMSYFANVSHEFRTPLTIISGPITQLVNDESVSADHHALLCIVQRSVNRMLRLVNQMLDFHKLEDDALRLQVKHQDIIGLLKNSAEAIALQAHEKNIEFNTIGLEDNFLVWMDADKMEKIMYNLLGNAVKYTQSGGRIDLSFDVISQQKVAEQFPISDKNNDTKYIKITVTDNGSGIPDDKLEKIFERYYQLDKQSNGQFNWGTGIGLYFVKRLVTLHHGYIKAENRPDGHGSIFSFIIPTSEKAYSEEEKKCDEPQNQSVLYPLASVNEDVDDDSIEKTNDDRQNILVIDDDVEIVHYVKTLLGSKYNVTSRFDAESGLTLVNDKAPDLILCDVMMGGKTGYEFCYEVKNDIQICHIPVILVTAKTTTQDQVKGLDCGADAYVTKPFDPTYLQALIGSILQNREKVRHLLGETTQTEKLEENVLSPQDNSFMTELYKIMEQELANPEIDVTHMTDLLHISRTKLYYKVKGLTGENPSIFFKRYKLNRAAELIKEGKYNFSEIADMTGFSTLSHFSTSFKKQFGVSPSEYK